jgi:predicted PurR-regulated permease PerM
MEPKKNDPLLLPMVITGLFVFTGIFVFLVYRTFFWTSFITLLFYIATRDYYLRFKRKFPEKLQFISPWIMILLVSLLVVLPTVFILQTLIGEALSLLISIKLNFNEERILTKLINLNVVTDFITENEFFWVEFPNTYRQIVGSYGDVLNVDSIYSVVSNTAALILGGIRLPVDIIVNILFGFLLLFFFYKDGHKLEKFLLTILPLSGEIREQIGLRVSDAMKAIVKGNLFISVLQGTAVGVLLLVMGVPSPVLYGSVAAIFSTIPIVGTMVIWLPAGLYLGIFEERWIASFVFMSLSLTCYLVLENFLKPAILDKKLNIHPFLLFLALLGGIKEFGIIGIIIGPIAVTLLVILWDFWLIHRGDLSPTELLSKLRNIP